MVSKDDGQLEANSLEASITNLFLLSLRLNTSSCKAASLHISFVGYKGQNQANSPEGSKGACKKKQPKGTAFDQISCPTRETVTGRGRHSARSREVPPADSRKKNRARCRSAEYQTVACAEHQNNRNTKQCPGA